MAQALQRPSRTEPPVNLQLWRRLQEALLIALGGAGLFVLISLSSHNAADPGWSHTGASGDRIHNRGGMFGAWLADVLLYLFGGCAYLCAFSVLVAGYRYCRRGPQAGQQPDYVWLSVRVGGFLLTLATGCALLWVRAHGQFADMPHAAGGILGDLVGRGLIELCGAVGGVLVMLVLFFVGLTLLTGLSWLALMDITGRWTLIGLALAQQAGMQLRDYLERRRQRRVRSAIVESQTEERPVARRKPRIEPVVQRVEPSERAAVREQKERQSTLFNPTADAALPALGLLDEPRLAAVGYSTEALEAMSRQVELKLRDFGIEVEVVAVLPGPVITRFELEPAAGVKASRITNLAKDLARSLSVISVRVVEVIPGKSVVGLEIPNERREVVSLSEILKSPEYEDSTSPITLALGKDIAGKPSVVDLARMPHLLVAGTTGSGKSVALNAMILSLLYKATAADVRLIMIDPKMLELSVYEGIPSLLAPVVTDMKEAANALRWCVGEMERRYRLMSKLGVRNLAGYNRKVLDAIEAGEPVLDPFFKRKSDSDVPQPLGKLPLIVVIVDELADMMMTVGKKVEELIARLAQKARAAGIHLILATQRPSVDVITGLIKANIPTRIAFQVSSRIDSRTILDQIGAESLLGHGDMLYLPPGTAQPQRVHGAFVSDQEVHKVVEELRGLGAPDYIEEILNAGGDGGEEGGAGFDGEPDEGGEQDALYDQAVRIVTESRRASISGVQRRLKIGYNRAARMMEDMERAGIVGELQSNGSREVLAPPPPPRD